MIECHIHGILLCNTKLLCFLWTHQIRSKLMIWDKLLFTTRTDLSTLGIFLGSADMFKGCMWWKCTKFDVRRVGMDAPDSKCLEVCTILQQEPKPKSCHHHCDNQQSTCFSAQACGGIAAQKSSKHQSCCCCCCCWCISAKGTCKRYHTSSSEALIIILQFGVLSPGSSGPKSCECLTFWVQLSVMWSWNFDVVMCNGCRGATKFGKRWTMCWH